MVSVIIPTYNRAGKILIAVKSVLEQSYSDLELIVVDDGSTDDTKNVLMEIHDCRLRYIYQENSGACTARNTGIEVAKGEYIAFQDSDDYWYPNKLERQLQELEKSGADVIFCTLRIPNADGTMASFPKVHTGIVEPHLIPTGISTQTLVMKREVAEIIKFDPQMPRFQDLDWVLRAAKQFTICALDEPLVDYDIGDDSISKSYSKLFKAVNLIKEKYPALVIDYPLVANGLASIVTRAGLELYEQGDKCYKVYLLTGMSLKKTKIQLLKKVLVQLGLYPYVLKKSHKKKVELF